MRIDSTYLNYAAPLLRDTVISQLTEQQKKVLVVASIAFALIAAFYLGYCFRRKEEWDNSKLDELRSELDKLGSDEPGKDDSKVDKPAPDEPELDGPGKMITFDGTVMEGEFTNGKLNGYGQKTLPDGTVEKGEFKGGKLNGIGMWTTATGNEIKE
jgi:hypothetical protein